MIKRSCLKVIAAACVASGLVAGCVPPPSLQSVMAAAGGTSADDAFVVENVPQEYAILKNLGLKMEAQALHQINGKTYDVLTARDPESGETREVWFDISRFFGRALFGVDSPKE